MADKLKQSFLFLLVLISSVVVYAGSWGKVAGRVVEADSGKPLVGASVMIPRLQRGAVTDQQGFYYILNLPPGSYTLVVQMIGYSSQRIQDVQVISDFTTEVNVELSIEPVDLGKEVVVTAERPLIQKDATSRILVLDSRTIANLPVESFEDVLSTQAGFTRDARGELHVRGGRSGELAYYVDGVLMNNPLSGRLQMGLNEDIIQEMVVVTGTFNAEYGDIMSGVINVTTREGENRFRTHFEYTSPMLNSSPYRQANPFHDVQDSYQYHEYSVLDKGGLPGTLSLTMSFPLHRKIKTFLAYRTELNDSYLPHGYRDYRDFLMKGSFFLTKRIKVIAQILREDLDYQNYNHKWKYRPRHQAHTEEGVRRSSLTFNHSLSSKAYYSLIISRLVQRKLIQVGNKKPAEYIRPQTGVETYFYVSGDDSPYEDSRNITLNIKGDLVFQYTRQHQFKTGFDLKQHELDVYREEEPWDGGLQFKEHYNLKPMELALYIQDKIETDNLILNLGLRFDFADPRARMWEDIHQFGYWDSSHNWIPALVKPVEPRWQLSPRIGIAYPVTEKMVFHFAYGRFFQNPDYYSQYYNYQKDLSGTLALVGNPRLRAQKTIAYETGVKYELNPDVALDFTAWYKDVTDLLSTQEIRYLSNRYVAFVNADYASIKGFDLTFRRRFSGFWSASLDYTFSIARGNNSDPLGGYFDAYEGEEIPHREYYLDFDQRHDFALTFDLATGSEGGFLIWKFRPFANFQLSMISEISSGLPYTPYVDPTLRVDRNSARMPWRWNVDLRLLRWLYFGQHSAAIYLNVSNLFNVRNVLQVFPRTGKPFDPGFLGVGTSPDANHNPNHVGQPRIIKMGIQIEW